MFFDDKKELLPKDLLIYLEGKNNSRNKEVLDDLISGKFHSLDSQQNFIQSYYGNFIINTATATTWQL